MWKSVLTGLILENIETLRYYQTRKNNDASVEDIFEFITDVIRDLPWYYRLPIRVLVNVTGLLCLIITGNKLNSLSSTKRSSFLRRVQFIPFFRTLNKLIRSLSFLRLFDALPLVSNYSYSVKSEKIYK